MFCSIKWRLALTYVVVVALAMTVLGTYLLDRLTLYAEKHLAERLYQHTVMAAEIITRDMGAITSTEKWQQLAKQISVYTKARVTVINTDGVVLADSSYSDVL